MTGRDPRHPWFGGDHPRVLAHRGYLTPADAAHGIAENSFLALAAAHAAGAEYLESDCHLTADGQAVLFHDDDLVRVAGDPRPVAAVVLRELEEIMSERGGLVTLRQALEAFPDSRFNLDVKAAAAAEAVGALVAPHAERVLLTSFSDARRRAALAAAERAGAAIRPATSAGTATVARVVAAVRLRSHVLTRRALAGVDALQVPEHHGRVRVVTRGLVESAHRAGAEVHVWTVNEPARMSRLLDLGVDGLVTDDTAQALRVVASR